MAGMGPGTPALAEAVAGAGALGTISFTYLGRAKRASATLDALAAKRAGALAVNFLMPVLDLEILEVAAARVRVIDLFWGDPDEDVVQRVHDGGALALWQVGSLDEARRAVDCGVDIIVAQGTDAGGHVRGHQPTFELLVQTLDTLEGTGVPILASGGFGTGRQIAAALGAGAAGVNVGTRLVATAESGAHHEYVQALVQAKDADESVATSEFAVSCPLCPSTHRVLRSALEAAHNFNGDVLGTMEVRGESVQLPPFFGPPPTPTTSGRIDAMALYAGRGVSYCRGGQTGASVITELAADAERILRNASSQLHK